MGALGKPSPRLAGVDFDHEWHGAIGEGDLPLPVTGPAPARFRTAREAWYEAGAQAVHAVGARR